MDLHVHEVLFTLIFQTCFSSLGVRYQGVLLAVCLDTIFIPGPTR